MISDQALAEVVAQATAFDSEHAPTVVYHSHPDGRATMSRRDRDIAMAVGGDQPAHPVDHLIIATGPHGRFVEAALFAWSVEDRDFLEVRQWPRNT